MGRVEVPGGRATVSTRMGALEITIPAKRSLFVALFLGVWLCGWFAGESFAIGALFFGTVKSGPVGFIGVWLCIWTVAGACACAAWLWNIAGREVLTIGHGDFVHRRAIGPLGMNRTYALSHVLDLRAVPAPVIGWGRSNPDPMGLSNGTIAFDYGAKTIRVGGGIDEAEAKQLVATIRNRLGS